MTPRVVLAAAAVLGLIWCAWKSPDAFSLIVGLFVIALVGTISLYVVLVLISNTWWPF